MRELGLRGGIGSELVAAIHEPWIWELGIEKKGSAYFAVFYYSFRTCTYRKIYVM
jgi:hypothetical protein